LILEGFVNNKNNEKVWGLRGIRETKDKFGLDPPYPQVRNRLRGERRRKRKKSTDTRLPTSRDIHKRIVPWIRPQYFCKK